MRSSGSRVQLHAAVREDVSCAVAERADDASDIYFEGAWFSDRALRAERIFLGGYGRHVRRRFAEAKTSPFAVLRAA
jgi:hypothetical protein